MFRNAEELLTVCVCFCSHKRRRSIAFDVNVCQHFTVTINSGKYRCVFPLPGGALNEIISKLENAGYAVTFNLYNAANFGTPQKRERVVIICSRDGKKAPYLEPTHSENGNFGLKKWVTFKQAINGLNKDEQEFINFPEKRLKYYRMLNAGENWKSLPIEFQKEAMGKSFYSGGGKTGFLRRLDWNKPSPTLVTHPAMPATDLSHPDENRPLSIAEYKRLQEFPNHWQIEGSILDKYKQIGNAVPVGLGYAIGKHLLKLMNSEEIQNFAGFKYSRYNRTGDIEWRNDFEGLISKYENKPVTL